MGRHGKPGGLLHSGTTREGVRMKPALIRLRNALPMGVAVLIVTIVQTGQADLTGAAFGLCAAAGVWIVHPLFAKRQGTPGLLADAALCLAGLVIGGAIAGTLLAAPGWGTILGLRAALALPFGGLFNALAIIAAVTATVQLARR